MQRCTLFLPFKNSDITVIQNRMCFEESYGRKWELNKTGKGDFVYEYRIKD